MKKIAILGGGITGLTAAYYLSQNNYQVTLIEKENKLGGLASGFKEKDWEWSLERAYHHLFASDSDILGFAKEIGFKKIYFRSPTTSSLFNNFRSYPLDTPFDLLKFPLLGLFDKLRTGIVIVFLKLSPFLSIYKNTTSEEFLKKTMGIRVWDTLWQQLFRGKFGRYAGIILAIFIWARINKRTKSLGYVEGGFQTLVDFIEDKLKNSPSPVNVLKGCEIKEIKKLDDKFIINGEIYDKVISTLPTPIMIKLIVDIFPKEYLSRFKKLEYLHAITLILETDKPILDKIYWLNICTDKIPFMILAQHTNFVDKKNYNNKNIAYIGWYVDGDSKLLKMDKEEILELVKPSLVKIFNQNKNFKFQISNSYLFKAPWAQPIFNKDFEENKPDFITPEKNFFIANLDMTYPYDRGTNYAVKLGKQVAELI